MLQTSFFKGDSSGIVVAVLLYQPLQTGLKHSRTQGLKEAWNGKDSARSRFLLESLVLQTKVLAARARGEVLLQHKTDWKSKCSIR